MGNFRYKKKRNNSVDFNPKHVPNSKVKNSSVAGSSDYKLRREKAVEGIMSLGPDMFSVVSSSHKRTGSTGYLLSESKKLRSRISANSSTLF